MTMNTIGVLIPAFNAAKTIGDVITGVQRFIPKDRIVVINDGSRDSTASVAGSTGVQVVTLPSNLGKGAALQRGFDVVLGTTLEAVVTMDADLQHSPDFLPRFLELYSSGQYDIIIGSRLHNMKGMPLHRILSNTITTFLVSARTATNISDSQSGYRLIGRNVLESVRLHSDGFEAETEFIIRAADKGFRFGVVPIQTVYGGEKSHMTHISTTVKFIKVLFQDY